MLLWRCLLTTLQFWFDSPWLLVPASEPLPDIIKDMFTPPHAHTYINITTDVSEEITSYDRSAGLNSGQLQKSCRKTKARALTLNHALNDLMLMFKAVLSLTLLRGKRKWFKVPSWVLINELNGFPACECVSDLQTGFVVLQFLNGVCVFEAESVNDCLMLLRLFLQLV